MTGMQAWLDQGKTLADRAADHVGRLSSGDDKWTMTVPPKDTDSDIALMSLLDGRLPQALDALQAVLDMHQDGGPSQGYVKGGYGEMEHTCTECGWIGEYGVEWPCPTVRAITDAIGGGDE